jgi:hypothetical protein
VTGWKGRRRELTRGGGGRLSGEEGRSIMCGQGPHACGSTSHSGGASAAARAPAHARRAIGPRMGLQRMRLLSSRSSRESLDVEKNEVLRYVGGARVGGGVYCSHAAVSRYPLDVSEVLDESTKRVRSLRSHRCATVHAAFTRRPGSHHWAKLV